MSVAETVLDYIQALIWPALVAVGVWVFRSQLKALLARIRSVEYGIGKVELDPVADVLKANLQESREELAKAEDPEMRERAAQKVERNAAALGRVEAWITPEDDLRRKRDAILEEMYTAARHGQDFRPEIIGAYQVDLQVALWTVPGAEAVPEEAKNELQLSVMKRFLDDTKARIPTETTAASLGPPEQVVRTWLERRQRDEPGLPS
jgi:hypothetical protein